MLIRNGSSLMDPKFSENTITNKRGRENNWDNKFAVKKEISNGTLKFPQI